MKPSAPPLHVIDNHPVKDVLLSDAQIFTPLPRLEGKTFVGAAEWIPNTEECQVCGKDFKEDKLGGRHHCRRCSICMCQEDSDLSRGVRMCIPCVKELSPLLLHQKVAKIHSEAAVRSGLINRSTDDGGHSALLRPRLARVCRERSGDIIDRLLDLLDQGEHALAGAERQHLLDVLLRVVRISSCAAFNEPGRRTRLQRIRVLLKVENEETELGEELLDLLGYKCIIFERINASEAIKYSLVMDKSGSMAGSLWEMAGEATEHMAEQIEALNADLDGMDLYLFSSDFVCHEGLRRCKDVEEVFEKVKPSGGTNLCGVLDALFANHAMRGVPEHVLVVTDGVPNKPAAVKDLLVERINALPDAQQFGITFMQIGADASAEVFLHSLQDDLMDMGARYQVVDALTSEDYDGLDICKFIHKHLPEKKHHEDDGNCSIF